MLDFFFRKVLRFQEPKYVYGACTIAVFFGLLSLLSVYSFSGDARLSAKVAVITMVACIISAVIEMKNE